MIIESLEDRCMLAPVFSMVFDPDTIGPGSTSTLTYTINNTGQPGATDLAFSNTLPVGVTISDAPSAESGVGGTFLAPAGGNTITLTDGSLVAGAIETLLVNVTSSTVGTHMNVTGDLTSSEGNSGTAADDLNVVTSLPGFSMAFADATIALGERTTLTYTIDNSLNESNVPNLDFTHNLPTGLVLAGPVNANLINIGTIPPTFTADPGGSTITLDADGTAGFPAIAANTTGTISVDVISTATGIIQTTTDDLLAEFTSAGKAADVIEVTQPAEIHAIMSFTDDPVPPGGEVNAEIEFQNFDRLFGAANIDFSVDLGAVIVGIGAVGLPQTVLTTGTLAIDGNGVLTVDDGTLGPGESATIPVTLQIPAGTAPGAFDFTTSSLSADIDGTTINANPVIDTLFVEEVPLLTMEFLEVGTLNADPVVQPGDDVVIRYSVTNTSAGSGATDITFLDELTDGGPGTGFLPFPVTVALPPVPNPPLGGGSSLALVSAGTDRQGLELTGGQLTAGADGSFIVTVTLPPTLAPGTYLNTTEEITATVNGQTVTGQPTSDTLTVIAAPDVSMVFLDDPVSPDSTVDLEFTFSHNADSPTAATDIAFTLDLAALAPAIPGLTASLPTTPDPPLGIGSSVTLSAGDTLITFAGGTLAPGATESFTIELQVPNNAPPGAHTATTSGISATVDGIAVTGAAVEDDLDIVLLTFEHSFTDPVVAGQATDLTYTFQNFSPTDPADITFFTHNLDAAIPGLAATGPPTTDTVGGTLSGTTFLTYLGGSVAPNSTAEIVVPVLIPLGTAPDDYGSVTGSLSFNQGGGGQTADPAVDTLSVVEAIDVTKTFLPDTVAPGDTTVLEYTIVNNLPGFSLSNITFTEDLNSVIAGLDAIGTPVNQDGFTINTNGSGVLTATGSLADGGTATFQVTLDVPDAAPAGTFIFTTENIGGDVDSGPAFGVDDVTAELTVTDDPDFGDAPDTYSTSLGAGGARHLPGGPRLGDLRDFESDAPGLLLDGTGDDVTGDADEDGVTIPVLLQGQAATIVVDASEASLLNAFIDFNNNGVFDLPNEQVATDFALVAGPNNVPVNVPVDAVNGNTFARFRVSTAGGLSFDGEAADGEVEDHVAQIGPRLIVPTLVEGQNIITVTDVTPGAIVGFARGTAPGTTELPQFGVTLDIAAAQVFGVGVADGTGTAIAILNLSAAELGQNFFFQAFEASPSPIVSPVEQQANPLVAAGGEGPGAAAISQGDLDTIVAEAKQRWIATGLTPDQIQILDTVTFQLGDLPADQIGQATGTGITIDPTAAGNGWFVDPTPADDSEFTIAVGTTELQADTGSAAENLLDLLTAVMHEIGHVLGQGDVAPTGTGETVNTESLEAGSRRLPVASTSLTIDNGDPGHSEEAGTWANSGVPGSNGSSTRFSRSSTARARWTPTIGAGTFNVSIFNVVSPSDGSTNVEVSVHHNGQIDTFNINQRQGPGGFIDLGAFDFDGGGNEFVEIRNAAGSGVMRADAVTFDNAPAPPQTPVADSQTIDNGQPGHSEEAGTWKNSGVPGSNGSNTRFSKSANARARWTPTIGAGIFNVSIFNVVSPSDGAANVEVSVHHNGQIDTFTIDQSQGPADFVDLGAFEFDGSGNEFVEIRNAGGNGVMRADAVTFANALLVPPPFSQTIDNGQPGHSEEAGTWRNSGVAGSNGSNTRFSRSGNARARWTPTIGAGEFTVSIFNVVSPTDGSTNVEVSVHHNGQIDTFNIDQTQGPAGFEELGTFTFDGGGNEFIEITNAAGSGVMRADAVQFVEAAAPLLAAGGEGTSGGTALTTNQLDAIVQYAAAQWMATTSGTLYDLQVRIEDLPGARLGEAAGNTITLDVNAAGHGWFVDETPETDEEFGSSDGPAAGKMDLLTVVFHEMGHLLGYSDDYSDPSSDDVMNGWLSTGERREPAANDLDALFGDETELDDLFQI